MSATSYAATQSRGIVTLNEESQRRIDEVAGANDAQDEDAPESSQPNDAEPRAARDRIEAARRQAERL